MARSKYPGLMLLNEIGTRADLAKSYGVSERTIYRWMDRARKEAAPVRQSYPGAETIAQFKGTRKQLAEAYGISERTAYRWINKAKSQGAPIPSRQVKSKYPGQSILYEYGTNRELGDLYNVSETTIRRWKTRAQKEAAGLPEEIYTPDQLPEEVFTPDQLPEEVITTEELPEMPEEVITDDSDELVNAADLAESLIEFDKIKPDSEFFKLDTQQRAEYIYSYIQYQSQNNPELYYAVEVLGMTDLDAESVATLNIWGDSFETWLTEQITLDSYNPDWLD